MGIDSFIHHCVQFLMELLRYHINIENTWRISCCIYYINNLFYLQINDTFIKRQLIESSNSLKMIKKSIVVSSQ